MKIAIEFDLTQRQVFIFWPWGKSAFYMSNEGISKLTEALENYAIQSTRVFPKGIPSCVSNEDLKLIRARMEGEGPPIHKFDEKGKAVIPSLDDLFGDDEMFQVAT